MKDWVRVYDLTGRTWSELEGSEHVKVDRAVERYLETGKDEKIMARMNGGGLITLRASLIGCYAYFTEESFKGVHEMDFQQQLMIQKVREKFPELKDN